jgi:hypothetical protein
LILLLATGFFLLRERRSSAVTNTDLTITTARTFASLDGSIDDDDGVVNGIFTKNANLTIASGGSITCDNTGGPGSACPINILVTGNLEIQAGGSIHAENLGTGGGTGGDIMITVGGDFTMRNTAVVSSRNRGGGSQEGGNITIVVGGVTLDTSVDPAIGVCNSPTGDILIERGALITSDSATGHAGAIALYAGHNITINGTVRAFGDSFGGHGGPITIDACCDLLIGDTGLVSSEGHDPGADRVHLEGCVVVVYGLVQSTAPGHQHASVLCTPPFRPGKPDNSTACVEIWSGTTLTIDATGTHHGQVNADVGMSGGTTGTGWIDVLANQAITLIGNTTTPYNAGGNPNVNSLVTPYWVLHANMALQNGHGGDIAVQSTTGTVTTSGRAIQANASTGSNGGKGGHVKVEASSNVAFGTSSIQAIGDIGSTSQAGGTIVGRSFNGTLTGGPLPGQLDAAGGPPAGSVTLFACLGVTYTGVSVPPFVLEVGPACGDPVLLPEPANTLLPLAICSAFCVPQTPTPTPTHIQELTRTPGICTEDPNAALTSTVDPSGASHGVPNFLKLQPAYDAAANGAVIGLFGKWSENVNLGGAKTLKITQCTSAQITAANNALPVWIVSSTGHLTIVGPDSVGGTIGWWLQTPNQTLKSVRANGASQYGILIDSNGNNVSWNDVSGNGPGAGVRVTGSSNILKGGDVGPNTGDGVQLLGNSNTISGATVESNTINGILVLGGSNQIKSNRVNLNTADGLKNAAGAGNNYSGNSSNTGGKENGGAEYRFVTTGVDGGSNRADGVNVPAAAKGCTSFNAGQVCE